MTALTLLAAVPCLCSLSMLAGWMCLLRYMRHVHDTSGADAVRPLYAVAMAYLGRWRPAIRIRHSMTSEHQPPQ